MNIQKLKASIGATLACLLLAACATGPMQPEGAVAVREKLTRLQADPQLASRAPVAIQEAEAAVREAEVPRDDEALAGHLVLMADRKVDIAAARAQARLSEDQRKSLGEQREKARLDARTREADQARSDAASARIAADAAQHQAAVARTDASIARADAEAARMRADSARTETAAAEQQSADLQREIAELNAKTTDRGLVVTLGDVLFASGGAKIRAGTASNLDRLAGFLSTYPDRTVIIEGHTDSVGSEDSNLGLSQRRADAVKSYLVEQGVASTRLTASGKGEASPAAGNDSATGRQHNRRVEVIISNTETSSR